MLNLTKPLSAFQITPTWLLTSKAQGVLISEWSRGFDQSFYFFLKFTSVTLHEAAVCSSMNPKMYSVHPWVRVAIGREFEEDPWKCSWNTAFTGMAGAYTQWMDEHLKTTLCAVMSTSQSLHWMKALEALMVLCFAFLQHNVAFVPHMICSDLWVEAD